MADAVRSSTGRWYRSWQLWLGGAVSLTLVVWGVWTLDWGRAGQALLTADLGWVFLALLTVLLTIAARVFRWRGLLLPRRFGALRLSAALLAGQVVNYVVLSQLGAVVRATALGQGNRAHALGTVVLEKLWDMVMLLALTAALSVALTLPSWLVLPARMLAVASTAGLLFLLGVLLLRGQISSLTCLTRRLPFVSPFLDGLEGLIRPRTVWWGLLGSLVVWGLGAATNYCVFRAFDLTLGSLPALLLLAALQAGVAVPSLPGSVGVFEGICIAVLALFGVEHEEALAVGLVLHAVVFLPPLLLGGVLMWRSFASLGGQVSGTDSPSVWPSQLPDVAVSVIIPAYNAAETLPTALEALESQMYPTDRYEVIVVDDGSADDTAEIAHSYGVRVISQPNAGPAAARNRGARAARGEILLFTDADCAPTPHWIERMVAAFVDPDVDGVKGGYRTQQRALMARFVQAEYEDRYDRMRTWESIDFVDTYSAAYRRDVFLEMGGFDTSFPTASVEDQELSFRLAEAGRRLVFRPDARVYHVHDRTVGEYARRKFWIGYWKVRVMREHPEKLMRDSHTPQVLKLQMGLAALGALLIVGGVFSWKLALIGVVAWGALLASGIPFLVKVLRRDAPVALVGPPLLFVRAWALGLGFLTGALAMVKTDDKR